MIEQPLSNAGPITPGNMWGTVADIEDGNLEKFYENLLLHPLRKPTEPYMVVVVNIHIRKITFMCPTAE